MSGSSGSNFRAKVEVQAFIPGPATVLPVFTKCQGSLDRVLWEIENCVWVGACVICQQSQIRHLLNTKPQMFVIPGLKGMGNRKGGEL